MFKSTSCSRRVAVQHWLHWLFYMSDYLPNCSADTVSCGNMMHESIRPTGCFDCVGGIGASPILTDSVEAAASEHSL